MFKIILFHTKMKMPVPKRSTFQAHDHIILNHYLQNL